MTRRTILLLLAASSLAVEMVCPAQNTPPRVPPVQRAPVPAPNLQPQLPPGIKIAPVPAPALAAPAPVVRAFNLDSALARLWSSLRSFSATGEFVMTSLGSTNAATVLPFSIQVLEARIRTELDLSQLPVVFDSNNPFNTLRQIDMNTVVSVTLPNLQTVHNIYPEAKAYLSHGLAAEDSPAMIQVEHRVAGRDALDGILCDKYVAVLTYRTGERREALVWQVAGQPLQPLQVQFTVGNTVLRIRLRQISGTPPPAERFDPPPGYTKYPDLGLLMQAVSARSGPRLVQ